LVPIHDIEMVKDLLETMLVQKPNRRNDETSYRYSNIFNGGYCRYAT